MSMNADNASKWQRTAAHRQDMYTRSSGAALLLTRRRAAALIIGETRAETLLSHAPHRGTIRDHRRGIITVIRVRGVQRRRNLHNRT